MHVCICTIDIGNMLNSKDVVASLNKRYAGLAGALFHSSTCGKWNFSFNAMSLKFTSRVTANETVH